MPNPKSRFKIKFNLLLDETDDARLIALAGAEDSSKARLCRRLIRSAYAMQFEQRPTCANNTACRCPHAHVYSPALPTPEDPTDPKPPGKPSFAGPGW